MNMLDTRHAIADENTTPDTFLELTPPSCNSTSKKSPNNRKHSKHTSFSMNEAGGGSRDPPYQRRPHVPDAPATPLGSKNSYEIQSPTPAPRFDMKHMPGVSTSKSADRTVAPESTSAKRRNRRRRINRPSSLLDPTHAPLQTPSKKPTLNPAATAFTPANFLAGEIARHPAAKDMDSINKESNKPINNTTLSEKTQKARKNRNRRRKVAEIEDAAQPSPSHARHLATNQEHKVDVISRPQGAQDGKIRRVRTRKRGYRRRDNKGSGEKKAETQEGGTRKGANQREAMEKVTNQHLFNIGNDMAEQGRAEKAQVSKSEVQKVHQHTKYQLLKQREKLLVQLATVDDKLSVLETLVPIAEEEYNSNNNIDMVPSSSPSVDNNASNNIAYDNIVAEPDQGNPRGCFAHWTYNDCRYGECASGSHMLPYQHEDYALETFARNPSLYGFGQRSVLRFLQREKEDSTLK